MKKNGLLFTLFLFFAGMSMAQVAVNGGFRMGLSGQNVYLTDALDAIIPEFRNMTGANVGAFAEFQLHEHFSLQPELAFQVKGFKIREDADINLFNIPLPVGVTSISRFSYVELPLLAKARFGNESVQAYLLAGPAVGYAVRGKMVNRARAFFEFDLFETEIDLDAVGYERTELSGIAGGGLELLLGRGKLLLEARYQHGFTQLYDIPLVNEQIRNEGFGFSLGYAMGF